MNFWKQIPELRLEQSSWCALTIAMQSCLRYACRTPDCIVFQQKIMLCIGQKSKKFFNNKNIKGIEILNKHIVARKIIVVALQRSSARWQIR